MAPHDPWRFLKWSPPLLQTPIERTPVDYDVDEIEIAARWPRGFSISDQLLEFPINLHALCFEVEVLDEDYYFSTYVLGLLSLQT